MEKISRDRLNEILHEQIDNPVALTDRLMDANGFRGMMPGPDFIIWANDHDITIIQEDDVCAVGTPFIFKLGEGNSAEKFELKYEHQLKLLIEDYESRLIQEVGDLKFLEGDQLKLF